MNIQPFKLERYFAKYEFSSPYLLSCSDCEPLSLRELLSLADGESMKYWNLLNLGYTESQGNPVLRDEITKLYNGVNSDDIAIMAPEEGIFIAMNVLLEKGDEVIVTYPGYQSLYEVARSIGCRIKKWEPKSTDGWHFDVESLETLITSKTKLMIINFPHNPTGSTISKEEQSRLIDFAEKNDLIIFSDEMYRYLEFNDEDRLPSLIDKSANAIVLGGMSKSFGLAGLRTGWLITKQKKWIEEFIRFKDYTTICNSAPSEVLALIGIRAKDKIIRNNLYLIEQNLQILNQFFKDYKGFFKWRKPRAGTIALPELLIDMTAAEFCDKLNKQQGVMLLPGDVYEFEGNHFRIGFGRKDFPTALKKLTEFIKNLE
ncbi:MAG: aminotransferase class I/II-fold pyridoxal phosphate-dependent enzyme [Bacteroidales bacterium]